MRFDTFISKRLQIPRNKALELILNESILLNDRIFKPAFDVEKYAQSLEKREVSESELLGLKSLKLRLKSEIYASRGALKLKAFLDEIKASLQINGAKCLDIGAAAGGFTQILLENGAKSVLALDVGKAQLNELLRKNERVRSVENTHLKDFKSDEKFEIITCDVSFISLKSLLARIDELADDKILLLFKPQFEVGVLAKRDKKGVLRDEKAVKAAKIDFERACAALKWRLLGTLPSKVLGKDGNVEYFYLYAKH